MRKRGFCDDLAAENFLPNSERGSQSGFTLRPYHACMFTERLRRHLSLHCFAWWIAATLLAVLQPFLGVHFGCDGWEDEPGIHIRSVSETTQFETDAHTGHPAPHESTIFSALSAQTDSPNGLRDGLWVLLTMLALAMPLLIAVDRLVERLRPARRRRPPSRSGAAPPAPWRRRPPALAPPLAS